MRSEYYDKTFDHRDLRAQLAAFIQSLDGPIPNVLVAVAEVLGAIAANGSRDDAASEKLVALLANEMKKSASGLRMFKHQQDGSIQ